MNSGRTMLSFATLAAVAAIGMLAMSTAGAAAADKPTVVIETSLGDVTVQLEPEKAPKTVENFLKYVDKGFYNGTIFHRVIPSFMIQGGGMTEDMREKPTDKPVQNESLANNKNGMSNLRGTIAMARTSDPDSATSQFFINLFDKNSFLDKAGDAGYTAFGKVTEGMDVVDKIAKVETASRGPHDDVPVKPIVIKSIKRKGK